MLGKKSFFFCTKNLNLSLKHLLLDKGINEQLYTAKYLTSQFKRVTVSAYFFPLAINRSLPFSRVCVLLIIGSSLQKLLKQMMHQR